MEPTAGAHSRSGCSGAILNTCNITMIDWCGTGSGYDTRSQRGWAGAGEMTQPEAMTEKMFQDTRND
jgi:hypothetical protein